MTAPAAIRATYSGFAMVKTRQVFQIVCEVPLDQAGRVLAVLGVPDPAAERWVGIALLNKNSQAGSPPAAGEAGAGGGVEATTTSATILPAEAAPATPKARRSFEELPPSQQAALKCEDKDFQRWLGVRNPTDAARYVRQLCDVQSRAQIADSARSMAAWRDLMRTFNSNPFGTLTGADRA